MGSKDERANQRQARGRIELHLEKKGKSRVHSDLRFTWYFQGVDGCREQYQVRSCFTDFELVDWEPTFELLDTCRHYACDVRDAHPDHEGGFEWFVIDFIKKCFLIDHVYGTSVKGIFLDGSLRHVAKAATLSRLGNWRFCNWYLYIGHPCILCLTETIYHQQKFPWIGWRSSCMKRNYWMNSRRTRRMLFPKMSPTGEMP